MPLPVMVFNTSEHNCAPLTTEWDTTHNVGWERDGTIHVPLTAAQTVAARAVSANSVHPP